MKKVILTKITGKEYTRLCWDGLKDTQVYYLLSLIDDKDLSDRFNSYKNEVKEILPIYLSLERDIQNRLLLKGELLYEEIRERIDMEKTFDKDGEYINN